MCGHNIFCSCFFLVHKKTLSKIKKVQSKTHQYDKAKHVNRYETKF